MSNGRKKDEKDVDETDVPDVSGGALPRDDGYIPVDSNVPYPRLPGGPIVRIDPPVSPELD